MARSAFDLRINVLGDEQIARHIEDVRGHVDDARPVWEHLIDYFESSSRRQFDSEGQSGSGGWKPLAPSTLRGKPPGTKILERFGRLRDSLTGESPDAIRESERHRMRFGSDVPYGVYHQSEKPRSRLPKRKPVELTEVEKKNALKRLQHYIVHGDV